MSKVKDYLSALNFVKPVEDPEDVEEFNITPTEKGRKCRLKGCGAKSGTLREIPHYYSCPKYFVPFPSLITNKCNKTNYLIKPEWQTYTKVYVGQRKFSARKYYDDDDVIVGSYGAGPCLILAMRDRETKQVTLAHIDNNTLFPLSPFTKYNPQFTDVYLVGGNTSPESVRMIHTIMNCIAEYTIKIIHIIDSCFSNSLFIHTATGEFAMNCDRDSIMRCFPPDKYQGGLRELMQYAREKTYYL